MVEPLFTRRFLGLWVFAFITFFSAFQLLPAIPFRILQLGGTTATAGLFLTVYTLASALSAPIMGTIADHVGRKRLLTTASFLFIIFSILYGVITWIPLLLLVGIVHGTLWSGLLSSASAIMSEFIPHSRRTEGLAYWGLAGTAGIAIGPMVGLLVFRYGWLALCLEMAALSVIMMVWSTKLPVVETSTGRGMPSLRDAWDWSVIRATLAMAVIAFGYGGVTSYAALLAVQRRILPESLFFTVFALTVVLVRIFTSRLGDRFGPKTVLYPSFMAIPVSFALLAVADGRPELILSGILFGIGLGGAWPAFTTYILIHSDPRRRARTFGSIVGAFDTGIASGSLVIGNVAQRYGFTVAFGIAAAISCLAIPIFMGASRMMTSPVGTDVAESHPHG